MLVCVPISAAAMGLWEVLVEKMDIQNGEIEKKT